MPVPPGRSRVVLQCRPTSLLIGAGLSVLTAGTILALGIIFVRNLGGLPADPIA